MPAVLLPEQQNNLDALRAWFAACPELKDGYLGIDYMGDTATQYGIFPTTSTLQTRVDVLGDVFLAPRQEENYIFASVNDYSADVVRAIEAHGRLQAVIAWMLRQNALKAFPSRNDGVVLSIVPSTPQYLMSATANTARYQIQFKVTYRPNSIMINKE